MTLEDVLSELIGEVGDEFKAGEPVAEPLPDGRMRLPGAMAGPRCGRGAAKRCGTPTRPRSADWSPPRSADLPAPGDKATIGGYEFEVERVADRALESVLAPRVAPGRRRPTR